MWRSRLDSRILPAYRPAWIGVGTLDLFHYENVTYSRRLAAAGVPKTEPTIAPGVSMDSTRSCPTESAVSKLFFDSQCGRLRRAFATS